jgi:hypothetical protein
MCVDFLLIAAWSREETPIASHRVSSSKDDLAFAQKAMGWVMSNNAIIRCTLTSRVLRATPTDSPSCGCAFVGAAVLPVLFVLGAQQAFDKSMLFNLGHPTGV